MMFFSPYFPTEFRFYLPLGETVPRLQLRATNSDIGYDSGWKDVPLVIEEKCSKVEE
jgi:hypothetical protein